VQEQNAQAAEAMQAQVEHVQREFAAYQHAKAQEIAALDDRVRKLIQCSPVFPPPSSAGAPAEAQTIWREAAVGDRPARKLAWRGRKAKKGMGKKDGTRAESQRPAAATVIPDPFHVPGSIQEPTVVCSARLFPQQSLLCLNNLH
jgi:hypothetical protein